QPPDPRRNCEHHYTGENGDGSDDPEVGELVRRIVVAGQHTGHRGAEADREEVQRHHLSPKRFRRRSSALTFELVSITTKYATAATMITPVVTCDRLDSLTNQPGREDHTIAATTATAIPAIQPIALRGNGFGAVRPCATRLRRNATYWARPSAMP